MPAVGDQHKQNASTPNPFEETHEQKKEQQHISEYTAQEIATLQSRLDKQLGPEYISSRPGAAGQKVHYLAAEKVINLANEIFGFNGWSSSIQNIQIDFVDEHAETRKISLGLSVIVRVTLKDGTYHEDVGYGNIENCKGKAAAFEKAKKEGTTDGLKRALRTFGNVLGNCVYDKDYVAKVTKIKIGAGKWDEKNLHRHADYAPKKEPGVKPVNHAVNGTDTSSGEKDDSFIDIADFDDTEFDETDFDHPDQVVLPADSHDTMKRSKGNQQQQRNLPTHQDMTTPLRPPNGAHPDMQPPTMRSNALDQSVQYQRTPISAAANGRVNPSRIGVFDQPPSNDKDQTSSPGIPSQHFAAQGGPPMPRAAAFYSARAAASIDPNNIPALAVASGAFQFNPHSESPSIRKTAGIDHNKSGKLLRDGLQPESNLLPRKDLVDPQPDPGRRLGAQPAQGGQGANLRPLNTSAYRPPTRRGPDTNAIPPVTVPPGGVDRAVMNAKRAPLSDLSNVQQHQPQSVTDRTEDGVDAKRQRMTDPGSESNMPPNPGNENKPVGGVG